MRAACLGFPQAASNAAAARVHNRVFRTESHSGRQDVTGFFPTTQQRRACTHIRCGLCCETKRFRFLLIRLGLISSGEQRLILLWPSGFAQFFHRSATLHLRRAHGFQLKQGKSPNPLDGRRQMHHWFLGSVSLFSQIPGQHLIVVVSGFLSGGNPFFDSTSVGMA